jgi:F0F1-type ATP synthase membrane subunit b/b'
MTNFIASIILLLIAAFVISLFPGGREFFGDIADVFTEKKTNVVEEYERVKGEVEEVKDTVIETKEKVEDTVDTVNEAVDTASDALDKVNDLVGNDEEETEPSDETKAP